MTKEKKQVNGFVMCLIVLTAICLVISAALAFTNEITAPIIEAGAVDRENNARSEVLPEADEFELVELSGAPETIDSVYKSLNDAGYVFTVTVKGYGGDMQIMCGIDNEGLITCCKTMSHSETAGLGAKTAESEYKDQYIGCDETLSSVQAISGATISSKAYEGAVRDAFTAYNMIKEAA